MPYFLASFIVITFYCVCFIFLFCVSVISNELQLRIKVIDIVRGNFMYYLNVPEIAEGMCNFYTINCVSVTMKTNFRLPSRCK